MKVYLLGHVSPQNTLQTQETNQLSQDFQRPKPEGRQLKWPWLGQYRLKRRNIINEKNEKSFHLIYYLRQVTIQSAH